jgi:hypothetical protein
MDWTSPFIVYRLTPEGRLEEVFHAEDLKKAKYWLTYIARPGDVLCKTPVHPKHTKSSKKAEYWSHKEASGQPSANEAAWKKMITPGVTELVFPEEQLAAPSTETV